MLAKNTVRTIGALTRPGTLTHKGPMNTAIFEATVAMTTTVNDRPHTAYVPVYAVGPAAERLFANTVAGSTVTLDGVVRQEKWTAAGIKRSRTRVHVLRSEVLQGGTLLTDQGGGYRLAEGGLNAVVLGGNLVSVATLRNTKTDGTGDPVCDFSVALNSSYRNGKGEKIETVDYVDVVAWRDLATQVASLPKGAAVLIEGAIVSESWTDKGGQKRSALKFQATKLDVVIAPVQTAPVSAAPVQTAPVQAAPVAAVQAAPVFEPPIEDLIPDNADYPAADEEDDLPF